MEGVWKYFYEMDELSLVDGEYEVGSNELVIDAINKIVI